MAEEFDTVDDIRTWLDEDEPSQEEAEDALEVEREGPDRTTGKMALNEYISSLEDQEEEPEEDDGTQKYVVMRPYSGYSRGDEIELDPEDPQTQNYVKDGRLQRR